MLEHYLLVYLQGGCGLLYSPTCYLCSNQRTTNTIVIQIAQVQCGTYIEKNNHGFCWSIFQVTKKQSAYSCGGRLLQQMVRGYPVPTIRCPKNSQNLCGKLDFTPWCPIEAAQRPRKELRIKPVLWRYVTVEDRRKFVFSL